MPNAAPTTNTYYDVLTSFEQGVNSGITPILLPKNQLAFALNSTVRGGNVTCRPPLNRQTLDFGGDADVQAVVLTGFFQGSGVYRPDFGPSQIIAQISGRLFAFTPTSTSWTVTEITVPGDPNDADAPQVWMWQSEKWMIIQNGLVLPIFYDGVSSRRSYGPSVVLATVNATAPVAPPALNGQVVATLTAPWTGPYNVPVIFNGAFYQPVNLAGGYLMSLKRISALPGSNGSPPVIGNTVFASPPLLGPVTNYDHNASWAAANGWSFPSVPFAHSVYAYDVNFGSNAGIERISDFQIPMDIDSRLDVGDQVSFFNKTYTVTVVKNATTVSLERTFTNGQAPNGPWPASRFVSSNYQQGSSAHQVGNNSPNFIIGNILGVISAVGDDFVVAIDREYTAGNNQAVLVGSVNSAFYIASPAPLIPPVGNDVTLINLSDTSTTNYVLPQDILSVPELPAGRMGAYGMGRNWLSLIDGISYVAGDIVGGAAGTQAANYRDSVLKMTENDFLSGGGSFRLPGSGNVINSMTFMATLDASQGQGALQIGTDVGMFSNNTPTDRDTWTNLTNPILTESLIGFGPLAQDSTVLANSDILFRSIEGLGSLVIARRQFGQWGNTPISREMDPTFRADNPNFLIFSSAVVFDNRFLCTVSPTSFGNGAYHRGVVALNFDTISSMLNKFPPVYDGLWTGLNILKFMVGNFSGTGRSFAFGHSLETGNLELYELLTTIGRNYFDNGTQRIIWAFETPVMFNRDVKPMSELVRLLDGEIYVQEVVGEVHIKVEYRPDFYPCWQTWKEFDICADTTIPDGKPGYRTRLSLGDPPSDACDEANNNRLLRVGHFFQFRFTFTGKLKFMGFRCQTTTDPAADFAPPVCAPVCEDQIPLPP